MHRHPWQSLNRDRHSLDEITQTNLRDEIECALAMASEKEHASMVRELDRGDYPKFCAILASLFADLSPEHRT